MPGQRLATESRGEAPAWLPRCLPDDVAQGISGFRYVMVDEVLGDLITLSVAPWPTVDEQGRVRFLDDGGTSTGRGHVLVHRRELHDLLYQGWLRRDPRPGDVFAAEVAPAVEARLEQGEDVPLDNRLRLRTVLPGVVCDVTAEARNVAKLAFYAGMAGVQPMAQAVAHRQVPAKRPVKTARRGFVRTQSWTGPHVITEAAVEGRPARWTLPADRLHAGPGLVDAVKDNPRALFYFLLNVGDADSQLLLLPANPATGRRRVVIVDAGTTRKLPDLLIALADEGIVAPAGSDEPVCALVVATHPHDDHIRGMAEILDRYGAIGVSDFWEPGYYAPTGSFAEMMAVIEEKGIRHGEPTAGTTVYLDGVRVTVLAPSVQLRTAYDSYGVDCNDASIVMRVDFPAVRIATEPESEDRAARTDLQLPKPWSMILGADAQTRSWSHVTSEFPQLHRGHNSAVYRGLSEARGRDYLDAEILKVSHHASKHGINIELIERIQPLVTLISSVGGGGRYGFPHALATQAIAEALAPTARLGGEPPHDADLGVHYTGGCTAAGEPLGSIALLVPPKRGARLAMWRFGDHSRDLVDLGNSKVLHPIRDVRKKSERPSEEEEVVR